MSPERQHHHPPSHATSPQGWTEPRRTSPDRKAGRTCPLACSRSLCFAEPVPCHVDDERFAPLRPPGERSLAMPPPRMFHVKHRQPDPDPSGPYFLASLSSALSVTGGRWNRRTGRRQHVPLRRGGGPRCRARPQWAQMRRLNRCPHRRILWRPLFSCLPRVPCRPWTSCPCRSSRPLHRWSRCFPQPWWPFGFQTWASSSHQDPASWT